ncbi:MAG: c-type cytochrome [Advenella sp.]
MITGTDIATRLWILALLLMGATQAMAQAPQPDLHIRVLAASCAACHGTNGVSVSNTPSLAGMPSAQFLSRMREFRTSKTGTDVMTQHARGLTTNEIDRLAVYFAALPAHQ